MASDKNKVIPTEIPIAAMSTLESPFDFPENRDLMKLIYHHSPYSKKIILDYYDSRFWIVDSLSVELGFRIPEPRIPNFTSKNFP